MTLPLPLLLQAAQDQSAKGHWAEAVSIFRQCLNMNPQHVQAHAGLALALLAIGDRAGAEQSCLKAMNFAPEEPDGWQSLARVLKAAPDAADARQKAEHVSLQGIRKFPGNVAILTNAGHLFETIHHFEAGAKCFLEASRLSPEGKGAHAGLARCLTGAGRFGEALTVAEQAIGAGNDGVDLHLCAGVALLKLGRFAEAASHLEAARDTEPGNLNVLMNLALALWAVKRRHEALQTTEAILAAVPNHALALTLAGRLCVELRRYAEAKQYLLQAAEFHKPAANLVSAALIAPMMPGSAEEVAQSRRDFETLLNRVRTSDDRIVHPWQDIFADGFYYAFQGQNDVQLRRNLAETMLRVCPDLAWTAPHCRTDETMAR